MLCLNSCALGPHSSRDRLIARMGIKIAFTNVAWEEKIYIGFSTGETGVPDRLVDDAIMSVYGCSTGNTSSFIAIRKVFGTGGCIRRVSLTTASR
jgi:hypothetical protein